MSFAALFLRDLRLSNLLNLMILSNVFLESVDLKYSNQTQYSKYLSLMRSSIQMLLEVAQLNKSHKLFKFDRCSFLSLNSISFIYCIEYISRNVIRINRFHSFLPKGLIPAFAIKVLELIGLPLLFHWLISIQFVPSFTYTVFGHVTRS